MQEALIDISGFSWFHNLEIRNTFTDSVMHIWKRSQKYIDQVFRHQTLRDGMRNRLDNDSQTTRIVHEHLVPFIVIYIYIRHVYRN